MFQKLQHRSSSCACFASYRFSSPLELCIKLIIVLLLSVHIVLSLKSGYIGCVCLLELEEG